MTIPSSVTSIGVSAFGFSGLTSVSIPNSVTSIGDLAFYECNKLKTIYNHRVEPLDCSPQFSDDNYKNTILYVPKGSSAAYEKVDPWRNFWNIEEKEFAGVDGVIADQEAKTEVGRFNLQGIEVGEDYEGLVIIRDIQIMDSIALWEIDREWRIRRWVLIRLQFLDSQTVKTVNVATQGYDGSAPALTEAQKSGFSIRLVSFPFA